MPSDPILQVLWGLGILVQLIGWALIPRAIMIARTPPAAIAWAFALAVLPLIAIPLFLVFGDSRFVGYTLAAKGDVPELTRARDALVSELEAFEVHTPEQWQQAAVVARNLTKLPATHSNRLELLINGEATFNAIFDAIDNAKRCVLVQFYIINDDKLGRAFLDVLCRAAARGVTIHLLYDDVGSKKITPDYLATLRSHGIKAHAFKTNRRRGSRFQINFRNHLKLVIVDNTSAFLGGLNVGDEYMGRSPRFGPWRDTHVRLAGPAIAALQLSFIEDWYYVTGKVHDHELPAVAAGPRTEAKVFAIPGGPIGNLSVGQATILEGIAQARHRLWIATPYLVPPAPVRTALQMAALRGVDVRILLPGMPDHTLPWWAAYTNYPALRAAGIKVFRYHPGFMHQKVLLADDDFAIVGSINLDFRSLLLNFELSIGVCDQTFATEVARMFEADFASAKKEDLKIYEKGSWWFRFRARLASLVSPEE